MTDPVIGIAFRRGQVIPVAAIRDAVLVNEILSSIAISDAELVDDELAVVAAIGDAELIEETVPVGTLAASPSSLSFGDVTVDATDVIEVVVTNTGDDDVAVMDVAATGQFTAEHDYAGPLAPDASFTATVTFAPTSSGAKSGALTIVSSASNDTLTVPLSGVGVEEGAPVFPMRMHTVGNQILDENDAPFRIKAVNWFGMEGTNYVPHGLWERPYRDMIDQMQGMGFNTLRIPFSGANANADLTPQGIDPNDNPEFASAKAIEVLDAIIAYCGEIGMYVILDHHRRTAGAGADGSPISETYTEANWHATWEFFATRYGGNKVVLGADLHNEPHDLTWDEWADLAEDCAAVVQAIAPGWLIFVEGVGEYEGAHYWWGGQLAGVADRPVVLSLSGKLVYSPHEYAQSVGNQSWLDYEWTSSPVNWPMNLYAVWRENWGFIFEDGIAPVWVGEFGGHFGRDANTGLTGTTSNGAEEAQWVNELVKYLNGDFDGDGDSDLGEGDLGISFAYWGWPPISGDTGGLVLSDWTTPQSYKLELLAPLLSG